MERIKTAVVGCGQISNIYIRNLKELFSGVELCALANRSAGPAGEKARQYGIGRVMTIDELADDPEIRLVVNLTAPGAHYEVIRKMLLGGKHVFTEKMFTTDLEQSRELCALAEERGLMLGVAPDTVLGAGIQTARKMLSAGMIGDVTSGLAVINRNQNLNSELFPFLRGEGGALPYDVGIYYIAALLALLGPVRAVRAFTAPALEHAPELLFAAPDAGSWRIPGSNVVSAALEFACGALVSVLFDGNTVNAPQHRLTLMGTQGILDLGDPNTFDGAVRLIRPESGECSVPFTHGYDGKNHLGAPSPYDGYGSRGVGAAEMAWAIMKGRPNCRCSKEYGLHCQEVLYGMDAAARTGTTYELSSSFVMEALPSGYYSSVFGGAGRGDAERSLME